MARFFLPGTQCLSAAPGRALFLFAQCDPQILQQWCVFTGDVKARLRGGVVVAVPRPHGDVDSVAGGPVNALAINHRKTAALLDVDQCFIGVPVFVGVLMGVQAAQRHANGFRGEVDHKHWVLPLGAKSFILIMVTDLLMNKRCSFLRHEFGGCFTEIFRAIFHF
jgi:hypothetical protein